MLSQPKWFSDLQVHQDCECGLVTFHDMQGHRGFYPLNFTTKSFLCHRDTKGGRSSIENPLSSQQMLLIPVFHMGQPIDDCFLFFQTNFSSILFPCLANEVTGSVFFRIFFQTSLQLMQLPCCLFFFSPHMNSLHIFKPPRDNGPSILKTDYFAIGYLTTCLDTMIAYDLNSYFSRWMNCT